MDLRSFAARIGMDERQLHKIVVAQDYTFTGWTTAERILEGLGLNSSVLLLHGDLHEVPARESGSAARRIIEDTYFALDTPAPTGAEMDAEIEKIIEARRILCTPSEHQQQLMDRDARRSKERRTRGVSG